MPDEQVVHILHEGLAVCGFSYDTPNKWPEGHAWVAPRDKELANCDGCKNKFIQQSFLNQD